LKVERFSKSCEKAFFLCFFNVYRFDFPIKVFYNPQPSSPNFKPNLASPIVRNFYHAKTDYSASCHKPSPAKSQAANNPDQSRVQSDPMPSVILIQVVCNPVPNHFAIKTKPLSNQYQTVRFHAINPQTSGQILYITE
jgi:hypothetical protein